MRAQISDAVKLDIKWSLTCQLSSTKSKRCPVGWESNTGNLVVSCVSCPLQALLWQHPRLNQRTILTNINPASFPEMGTSTNAGYLLLCADGKALLSDCWLPTVCCFVFGPQNAPG